MIFNTSKWEKNIKQRSWKIHLSPESGKNRVIFFISLRI